jgi:hypothetical protein
VGVTCQPCRERRDEWVFDEDEIGGENSEEQQSSILSDVEAMFEENFKRITFEMNSCSKKIQNT